jgi:2,4-dienoyl-CoA reductase-like NADH-dependent reductase (Old Yellow Enzyme family)
MSLVFENTKINGMELANRFVRSATWEGMATSDGKVTPELIRTMADLAQGGVGLIISGQAYVQARGQAAPWQMGIQEDRFIPGLCEMTDAVHNHGGKIVVQLAHAGMVTNQKLTGQVPLVVSKMEEPGQPPCREITAQDVLELTAAFAEGAARAKQAGFDGVQIHAAHGYLLSQFLSPAFNRRQDQYGGDVPNRSRVLMEVYQAIRTVVGAEYPVLIKLNCQDFIENGLNLEDSLQIGRMLSEAGIDAIELSGGVMTGGKWSSPSRPAQTSVPEEPYYLNEARAFKNAIDVPLILVGGIRSLDLSQSLVKAGITDYIAMSRPLIMEPDLINRWKSGDSRKTGCKSDNKCFKDGLNGKGICCALKNEA